MLYKKKHYTSVKLTTWKLYVINDHKNIKLIYYAEISYQIVPDTLQILNRKGWSYKRWNRSAGTSQLGYSYTLLLLTQKSRARDLLFNK